MNFDDLDKMFADMIEKIPEKKEELLDNVGNLIAKQVKANITERVSGTGEEKENLIADIEVVKGSGKGYVAVKPKWDKSHLHYLIEQGHKIVSPTTKVPLGRFVKGKYMYRDAIEQCSDEILELAQDMVDEVVKND